MRRVPDRSEEHADTGPAWTLVESPLKQYRCRRADRTVYKEASEASRPNAKPYPDTDPAEGILGPWHANLREISESPAILFANDRTLLNFFIDINPDGSVPTVSCILADLGVSENTRKQLLVEYAEIGYAPTNNRRVIGSMNKLINRLLLG